MNEENVRGFTHWSIPVELRTTHNLSWPACVMFAEIHGLSRGPKGCFASNAHFASHLGVNERRVKQILASLKAAGLVRQVGFDGRVRRLEPLFDVAYQQCNKLHGGDVANCPPDMQKIAPVSPPSNREKEKSKEKAKEEERASAQPLSVPKVEASVSKPRRTSRNAQPSPEAKAIIQAFAEVYRARFRVAYVPNPMEDGAAATFMVDQNISPEQVASTFEAATRSNGYWASKATTLPVLFRRWAAIQAELTQAKAQRPTSGASDSQVATEEWLAGMNGE